MAARWFSFVSRSFGSKIPKPTGISAVNTMEGEDNSTVVVKKENEEFDVPVYIGDSHKKHHRNYDLYTPATSGTMRGFSLTKGPTLSIAVPEIPKVKMSPKAVAQHVPKVKLKLEISEDEKKKYPEGSWLARGKFLPPNLNPNDDYYNIFAYNREWVKRKTADDPRFFEKMAEQNPKYLFIGCADSRVDAYEVTGLKTGSMFVHRNIANLVVASDINLLSVLQYSVEMLHIKDIMIVGHYGCGGVKAAMESTDLGLVENWLRNIRDVRRMHAEELDAITDIEERYRRLVELNVYEQCLNIYKTGIVQEHVRKYGYPRVHGLVYELKEGILKQLDIDFEGYIEKYQHIYAIGKKKKKEHTAQVVAPAEPRGNL